MFGSYLVLCVFVPFDDGALRNQQVHFPLTRCFLNRDRQQRLHHSLVSTIIDAGKIFNLANQRRVPAKIPAKNAQTTSWIKSSMLWPDGQTLESDDDVDIAYSLALVFLKFEKTAAKDPF